MMVGLLLLIFMGELAYRAGILTRFSAAANGTLTIGGS